MCKIEYKGENRDSTGNPRLKNELSRKPLANPLIVNRYL